MVAAWREDDGAITVFVVALTLALMMVAGLVYDGGRLVAARRQAMDVADNAARAGAQAVDIDALRSGSLTLDPLEAAVAAESYLATAGYSGDIAVSADGVEVTVSITTPMVLLQLVGIDDRTITGHGEARVVRGVSGPES